MSGSAAFDQAFPPCTLQCVIQYPTLETACAAVTTIVACGEAACRGADLARFEAFLADFVPLCGAAPPSFGGSAAASRTAVTRELPATVAPSSSIQAFLDIIEGATSTVSGSQVRASSTSSPTSSPVSAAAGFSPATESNSIGLYAGVGVGIAGVIIAAVVFFVTQNQRKRAAIERLHQMPHEDLQDQHKGYDALNDTLSINANVASPTAPPAINLHSHADAIHSSESQKLSGKIQFPASSSWDVLATPISDASPAPVSKISLMNAVYVTPTYRGDEKRDIVTSDGPRSTQQFIVADSRPYHVGNALEIPQPPVLVTMDPSKWSVAEVEAWARALPHFGNKLGNIMLEYQINGRVLMGLTRNTMKDELGLVFGEVSQLAADIAQLRDASLSEAGLPPGYDA
ncbi:hypothetical protein BJ741DRAFT_614905 [Chytriomyces cf. hyalinus JEL632]|nr:hypothetical protein BJ741DRAFT_614905 [Chytriomyces cf. hyalinus JEL632]